MNDLQYTVKSRVLLLILRILSLLATQGKLKSVEHRKASIVSHKHVLAIKVGRSLKQYVTNTCIAYLWLIIEAL